MSETTVRPDGPEREPDNVTPCWACKGTGQDRVGDDLEYEVFECAACDGTGLNGARVIEAQGLRDLEVATRDGQPIAMAEVIHFDAGRLDQYAACGYDLDRNPEGWTTDHAKVTCSACELEITPDEGDEDDLVPAPGCGHPMPPGVDCCVSTQAPAEVPVCLAASRHGGICGQPAPCDGSRHVEPAPVVDERRTVSLETLTPALLAEEEQRRRVEAREQGVSFEPIPAAAKVAVVARVNGLLGGVWDTDADWMATRADLLVAMLRSASDLAADGEAELLMPTPDVLAALDGRPDAQLLTAPVWVLAMDVTPGMLLAPESAAPQRQVTGMPKCTDPDCVYGSCTVFVVDELPGELHQSGYARTRVRIPAEVTR